MKIVNGSIVQHALEEYSYFVLPTEGPESNRWLGCGASIISPTFALTSAHCFGGGKTPCLGPQQIAVWVGDIKLEQSVVIPGSSGKSFRTEADLVCNPEFDGVCAHGHDVALLKLHKPVPDWVKPVHLDLHTSVSPSVGQTVTAVGFGLVESEDRTVIGDPSRDLRMVGLTVLGQDIQDCERVFKGGYGCSDQFSEDEAKNKHQQICVGANNYPERDTCSGDSGSPLIDAHGVQVGIVSYGGGPGSAVSGPGRECGDPEYPGVYALVPAFADFLLEHVHDLPGATAEIHVG